MSQTLSSPNLAALGAYLFSLQSHPPAEGDPIQSMEEVLSKAAQDGVVRCLLTAKTLSAREREGVEAEPLDRAWQALVDRQVAAHPHAERLTVGLELIGARGRTALSPTRVLQVATQVAREPGVARVVFSDQRLRENGPWSWPLRIGFLDDPLSLALRQATTDRYFHQDLIDVHPVRPGNEEQDLVVLPRLPDPSNWNHLRAASIGAVLILVEPHEALPSLEDLLELRKHVACSALAAWRPGGGATQGLGSFLDLLAHDRRLDEALSLVAGDPETFLVVTHPQWLASASLGGFLKRLEKAERQFTGLGDLSPDRLWISGPRLAALRAELPSLGFFHEDRGARAVAECMREIRSMLMAPPPVFRSGRIKTASLKRPKPSFMETSRDGIVLSRGTPSDDMLTVGWTSSPPTSAPSPKPTPRWLQTQVREIQGARRIRCARGFQAGRSHEIKVRIGPEGAAWLRADGTFPYHTLPPSLKHELEVLLCPTWPGAEAQRDTLVLWPQGPSTEAAFVVEVPKELLEAEVRVQVLHEGRHVQSGILQGPVNSSRKAPGTPATLRFVISPPSQADRDHQRPADLTVSCQGDLVLLRLPSQSPYTRRLTNLQEWIRRIHTTLFEASEQTAWLESGISGGAGLDLILTLAIQGYALRTRLLDGIQPFPPLPRIEVLSECASESLPIEFLYDFAKPNDDAALCERFQAPALHPCADCTFQNDSTRVCPFGFWGLNREIGRQLVRFPLTTPGEGTAPESSGPRPALPPLRSVQMAASTKVDLEEPGLAAKTFEEIRALVQGEAKEAESWAAWKARILEKPPSLMVLLPHHESTARGPALEIGAKDRLRVDQVANEHVASPDSGVVPIVLLFGCNTAAPDIGFQDLIGEFRDHGAGLVIGTTTRVLGRQAAPAATEFVRQLCDPSQVGLAVSEVMRRARTHLLQEGNLLSLALVAYGDADWLIE